MYLQQLNDGLNSTLRPWDAVASRFDQSKQFLLLPIEQDSAVDRRPGWYWRTPEGKSSIQAQFNRAAYLGPLDDAEIGWQREED